MDVLTLLHRARQEGLGVWAEGDKIVVEGPPRLAALAKQLIAHKPAVMPLLVCDRCGAAGTRLISTYWTSWAKGLCPVCVARSAKEYDDTNSWPPVPWGSGELSEEIESHGA